MRKPILLAALGTALGFTGAKLEAPDEDDDRARLEARLGQLRHLLETLDLLFDAFGTRRFGPRWNADLTRIQKWLREPSGER